MAPSTAADRLTNMCSFSLSDSSSASSLRSSSSWEVKPAWLSAQWDGSYISNYMNASVMVAQKIEMNVNMLVLGSSVSILTGFSIYAETDVLKLFLAFIKEQF